MRVPKHQSVTEAFTVYGRNVLIGSFYNFQNLLSVYTSQAYPEPNCPSAAFQFCFEYVKIQSILLFLQLNFTVWMIFDGIALCYGGKIQPDDYTHHHRCFEPQYGYLPVYRLNCKSNSSKVFVVQLRKWSPMFLFKLSYVRLQMLIMMKM